MARLKTAYLAAIFLFLYAPIGILIAQSFNESKYRGHWTGFSLKWYESLFENDEILEALSNTLSIGILSALIATVLGLVTCLALREVGKKWRAMFMSVANVPILNADIVTGISLMLLFLGLGIRLGYGSILMAHVVFNVPYVILCIMPQLMALDKSSYEAALDLGASPLKAFTSVVLPELRASIFAGFLLAFTMSADDFIITYFTRGAGVDTLSTAIYSQLKLGIHPDMYALSTLVFFSVLIFVVLFTFSRKKLDAEVL